MATQPWRSHTSSEDIHIFGMTHEGWGSTTTPSKCICGFTPGRLFEWLNPNPPRIPDASFWICAGITGKECNFSKWEEEGMCPMARILIYCMVKRINNLYAAQHSRRRGRILFRLCFILPWIMLCFAIIIIKFKLI